MSDTVDLRRAWLEPEQVVDEVDPVVQMSPVDDVVWPDAAAPTIGNDPPGTALSYCGSCPTVFSNAPCCG